MRRPKILVVAANWWALPGQISIALAKVGFQVAILAPPASVVREIKSVHAQYIYQPWAASSSIVRAMKRFSPNFLVCTDDKAVVALHNLYRDSSDVLDDQDIVGNAKLIEASLGNPGSFKIADAKSELMAFAQSVGIRCPKTLTITDETMLDRELKNASYPIVLKADESCGGIGVRIVNTRTQAQRAFKQLAFDFTWRGAIAQIVRGLTLGPLVLRFSQRRRTVTLQEYIEGRSANRAVVCLNGVVLAGLSVEALQTIHANGPATVVRIIDHAEMHAAAAKLAKHLKLSGFCGFDFVIDSSNQAWLLEMNPRVTPISSLSAIDHTNLSAALFCALTKTKTSSNTPPIENKLIAMFPQKSTGSSCDLYSSSFHDVPEGEPQFVHACSVLGSRDSFTGAIAYRFKELLSFRQKTQPF